MQSGISFKERCLSVNAKLTGDTGVPRGVYINHETERTREAIAAYGASTPVVRKLRPVCLFESGDSDEH